MLNLHPELNTAILATGESFAVATITGTHGSTPHPPGTSMLIHANGSVTGSLSGGCIEGAVHAAALEAMAENGPRREHYGYPSADAFAPGVTCGGQIEVHIAPFTAHSPMHRLLVSYAEFHPTEPVALVRRIDAGSSGATLVPDPGKLSLPELAGLLAPLVGGPRSSQAATACFPLITAGRTGTIHVGRDAGTCTTGSLELLVESRLAPPRLLVFGANTFAEELLKLSPALGYASTLCDARAAFTLQQRFNTAHETSTLWPHQYLKGEIAAGRIDARTVVCVLGHDPKFDIPLLALALGQDLAYVGAMGSRTSHASRLRALRAAGVSESALAALRSPIGLDLQATTPGEVAIGIAAEIIAARNPLATGAPLAGLVGPIHRHGSRQARDTQVASWT